MMFTELNTAGHHDDAPSLELLPELQLQQSVSLQIVCIEDICLRYTHGHINISLYTFHSGSLQAGSLQMYGY